MPTSCGRGLPAVHQGHDDDVTYTADQLDRDAVSERQRRTVLGQFKDAVLPEVLPGRDQRRTVEVGLVSWIVPGHVIYRPGAPVVEVTFNEAEARLSEIVTAAQNGERVVITRDGEPAVELVRCREKCGSIDFDKLEADRRRLGIRGDEERWPEEFNDPAFSRHVLGLEEDE